jgi:hypothetical protein
MIISVNPNPSFEEFYSLMRRTDSILNEDGKERPKYYASRGGKALEDDVVEALNEGARGTVFENSIEKISGQKFPDIVANKFYGVEVKSTKENKWKSVGGSILESSRISDVKRIFMTFGKLGGSPIEFISRPYEECLYDIAVTHMPRYLIDMQLGEGETIFDKLGISYDVLRQQDDPISPVSKYYRDRLKPGETLWWAKDNATEESVPAKIRLWKNLPREEKNLYTAFGCVNFPEVFRGDYDRYSMWLTSQGIVDAHVRDQFSAGGTETISLANGTNELLPGIYRRIRKHSHIILSILNREDPSMLVGPSLNDPAQISSRISKWIEQISLESKKSKNPPTHLEQIIRMLLTDEKG